MLILLEFLMYCSIICRSDCRETLLVTAVMPKGSDQMKSTRTSDFAFLSALLMLVTCIEEFFMNFILLLLLIVIITCFLDGPFIVIWICDFGFEVPLTILLIWSIFFAPIDRNISLILITSDVLIFCFKAWVYNFGGYLVILAGLLLLKNLEITLIFFWDLVEIGGGILFIFTRDGLLISLLFLPVAGWLFGVNLATFFLLRKLDCLSV